MAEHYQQQRYRNFHLYRNLHFTHCTLGLQYYTLHLSLGKNYASMTFCDAIFEVFITAIGIYAGLHFTIKHERNKERLKFNDERKKILKELLESLQANNHLLAQITDKHFNHSQLPSFSLDTVALAFVTLNARKYLPEDTEWAQKYNGLRFELDHINRKIDWLYIFNVVHFPSSEIVQQLQKSDESIFKSLTERCASEFENLKLLITNTQKTLGEAIATLERFV